MSEVEADKKLKREEKKGENEGNKRTGVYSVGARGGESGGKKARSREKPEFVRRESKFS